MQSLKDTLAFFIFAGVLVACIREPDKFSLQEFANNASKSRFFNWLLQEQR